jgi:hypothetical protein
MVLLALFSTFPWLNGRTARVGVPPSPQLHTGTETREGTSETNHPPITAHMGGTDYTYPGDVGSWRYRCRGQTAVKHAKEYPQAKWRLGLRPTSAETGRLAGSWVTARGKRRQLSKGRASLIRMRSLVQIQVGPHPESPVPTGFSPFFDPPEACPNRYRGQTRGQTCQALAKQATLQGHRSTITHVS